MSEERTSLLSGSGRHGYGSSAGSTSSPAHQVVHPKGGMLERQLSLYDVHEATELSWNHVSVSVKISGGGCFRRKPVVRKQILSDVSGIVKPGELIAIMGASGAGKSTLLNVLTQRNLANLDIEGDVRVNGSTIGRGIQRVSAYVQQDDIFIGTLTVKEQLWFTAMLRMDSSVPTSERDRRVDEVLREIGLGKCADSQIGVAGEKKSISGGERKRLAFASEILTNPSLLFCDEPTSGLDSFMAESVVQSLKAMASRSKTILCTIHQPSSEVFALFDNILLLAEGKTAFMGTSADAIEFFNKAGFSCPLNYNPADHYIATLAIAPGREEECRERVQKIVETNAESPAFQEMIQQLDNKRREEHLAPEVQTLIKGSPYKASAGRQFRVVTWRSWVAHMRDPVVFRARMGQSAAMALLFGLIYLQQVYDQKGVMNINGALFLLQIGGSLAYVFGVINTFPKEYPIFLREHQNGMYTVFMYYIGKMLAETLTFLLSPAIMATIAYWMIGLYPAAYQFGIFVAVLVLIANVAVSFGYMISCVSDNVTLILTIGPLVQTPLMLFGGFFLNAASTPVYLIWLKYISWFNYANEILVVNQWRDVTNITCNSALPTPTPTSLSGYLSNLTMPTQPAGLCYRNGQMVISSLSYHEDNVDFDFIMLGVLLVGFRILAYVFLVVRTALKK